MQREYYLYQAEMDKAWIMEMPKNKKGTKIEI